MTVADRIKERREKLSISQEDLAAMLGLKDKSSISKIENSGDKVSLRNIEKIAPLLRCSVQYLMGWDDEKQKSEPAEASSDNEEFKEFFNLYKNADPEHQKLALIALTSGQQHS